MKLKPITCPNCGGRVDVTRLICEFCGTRFKADDSDFGVIKLETFTSPTRVLGIETRVANEFVATAPEQVLNYAKREIAEKLAIKLLQGDLVEFRSEMDFEHCQQIISARLRVLEPHYRY